MRRPVGRISSPGRQGTRMAISLHILPEGRKTTAALPRSSATISWSWLTVGSSLFCSVANGDEVLPWRPLRRWVLTVPHRLRYQMAWDHGLSEGRAEHIRAQAL